MYKFSRRSRDKLYRCEEPLITLFEKVIEYTDCTIFCGYRDRRTQQQAFEEGRSKVQFPDSKHNHRPSSAVDAGPYPIDWEAIKRWYMFVGIVRGVASMLDIPIRCGADWDGDMIVKDQNFHDLPHVELIK